jgi:hypothetical protein
MEPHPWQVATWIVTAVGAPITVALAVGQAILNRRLRARELRWKQTQAARELTDEIFEEEKSRLAITMLEPERRKFTVDGQLVEVGREDVLASLRLGGASDSPQNIFIRDCFDTLFYFCARMEHSIEVGLTTFEDLRFPAEYYVDLMATDKAVFEQYIAAIQYRRVLSLLDRFSSWRDQEPSTRSFDGSGRPLRQRSAPLA